MTADLRTYLASIAAAGGVNIQRIKTPVSGDRELSAVVKRAESESNPIFIFESVAGAKMPVVCGLYASRRRVAIALGTTEDRAVQRYLQAVSSPVPTAKTNDGPVKEVRICGDAVDLNSLPILTHAPLDSGRYITAGVGIARDETTGAINAGIYRLQITGPRSFSVCTTPAHDLGKIIAAAKAANRRVPFAVVLGHHPAFTLASQAGVPIHVDTLEIAGSLLGEPLKVMPADTIDLPVPAHAEVVIEGMIDPTTTVKDGPFGEFTYYYGIEQSVVCEVTAITHRADAYYVDLHNAHVEHRCLFIFPGSEARLFDRISKAVSCPLRGVHMPFEAGGLHVNISLVRPTREDARAALEAALGHESLMIKHAIAVDEDIDPANVGQVLWALTTRFQADRDIILKTGKARKVDPSSWRDDGNNYTTAMGMDATFGGKADRFPRSDLLGDGAVPI